MAKYRDNLPQLSDKLFLTDSGLETTLVFHEGMDLPAFAAFPLLDTDSGYAWLDKYFRQHIELAKSNNTGFVLESVTWRANPDWAGGLGYSTETLAAANRKSIEMLVNLRAEFESPELPMVISGQIGPRGDGYNPEFLMSADEAETYHSEQINTFAETEADMVSALTITYPAEAIGITNAAKKAGIPAAISFTLETDGKLISGLTLKEAIEAVDTATDNGPAYYMINCAHPTHFADSLEPGAKYLERIRGIRANASCKSHEELDNSTELDDGDPVEFGAQHAALKNGPLKNLTVMGGCCGSDYRHVAEIAKACSP